MPIPAAPSNTAYEPAGTATHTAPSALRSAQYEPDAQGVLESLHEAPKAIVTAAAQSATVVATSDV